MSYSDFTLTQVSRDFHLSVDLESDLYRPTPEVEVSSFLREALERLAPLGLRIGTEKARSEFIIAPILAEVAAQARAQVGLFSGAPFSVEPSAGLHGTCDFLFCRPPSLEVTAPVLIIVEAKREDLNAGTGQCAAAMVAARLFNQREGHPSGRMHGAVTSGTDWRFLRLDGSVLHVDRSLYYLDQVGKLVAIMLEMLSESEPSGARAA